MQLFLYSPLGKAALSAPSCEAARLRHIGECCWQAVHACADWQAHLSREPLNAKLPLLAAAPIKRASDKDSSRTLPLLHAISTKSKLQQIDVADGLPRVAYPRPEMKVSTPLTLQNIRIQPH